jgi:hypothetical protein
MTRPRDLDRRAQPGNSCTQDDNRSDRSHLPRDWQTVDADGWVTAAFPAPQRGTASADFLFSGRRLVKLHPGTQP